MYNCISLCIAEGHNQMPQQHVCSRAVPGSNNEEEVRNREP